MDEKLIELVEQVGAKYPAIGDRAQKAAEIVERKSIEYAGMQHGRDYWKIGHYTTSVRGGSCTCADLQAPQDDHGGKLCKHRIAAMFMVKRETMNTLMLERIIRGAPSDELTLRVDVLFTDDGRQYTIAGYKYAGQPENRLEYAERFKFTEAQMTAALNATAWTIAQRPSKQRGYSFTYFLARIASLPAGAASWTLGAYSYEQVEWAERAKRFKELQVITEMTGEFADEAERITA